MTSITVVLIFCKRSAAERPTFVTLQTILLLMTVLLYATVNVFYFVDHDRGLLDHFDEPDTKYTILLVFADLCYILHDWLLTEQLLMMALTLPIATDFVQKVHSTPLKVSHERVKRIRLLVNIVMASLTLLWFSSTLTTGLYVVRMCFCFLLGYQIIIFIFSLVSLRSKVRSLL